MITYSQKKAFWQKLLVLPMSAALVALMASPLAAQTGEGASGASVTSLVFDVSGSMSDTDPSGQVKIEAAKRAANTLVNLIETENSIQPGSTQVAVAAFNSSAQALLNPTTDLAGVRRVINGLSSSGGTNMADGLYAALTQLSLYQASSVSAKFITLLSDGQPSVAAGGLASGDAAALKREVLSGPVHRARQEKVCINVIGLGAPSNLDETFLRQIVSGAGCGQYVSAADASLLGAAYVRLRHSSMGAIVGAFQGSINQGQSATIGMAPVPQGKGELHVTLQWPGSALSLNLADPSGRKVDASYPGATISTFSNLVYAIIKNPPGGNWTASAFGNVVPEGTLKWDSVFSVRGSAPQPAAAQKPKTDWAPLIIVMLALFLGMGLGAAVMIAARSGSPAPGYAGGRVVPAGGHAPLRVPRGKTVRIGRGRFNDVSLEDSRASRSHAEVIAHGDGAFTVRDLGSRNGTRLNGKPVSAAHAYPGDTLQIGDTELELE